MITNDSTIFDEKYKIIKLLTKSGYNKIYLASQIQTQEQVVIKMSMSRYSNINLSLMENQVKFHQKISSQNVIKFIEEKINGKKKKIKQNFIKNYYCHYIVLEYAEKGELFEYIKMNKGVYHKVARFYFKQLINGLEDMHNLNVCHRDIKLDNLLLDDKFNLKIADFEFCQEIKNLNGDFILHSDKMGTMSYMAPEFFNLRKINNSVIENNLNNCEFKIFHIGDKVDIFAAGVVLFILLTGMFPFKTAEKIDKYYRLFYENKQNVFWQIKKLKNVNLNIPESAKDLLNRIFEPDPDKRISIKEIKEHFFYNEDVYEDFEICEYMNNILMNNENNNNKKENNL